jgi:hypothetical protein
MRGLLLDDAMKRMHQNRIGSRSCAIDARGTALVPAQHDLCETIVRQCGSFSRVEALYP